MLTPFAIQPGQVLLPESCAVALRVDGPFGSWVGMWRPADRRLRQCAAPEGWLPGAGLWTADGELRLPYATPAVPCGVARVPAPEPGRGPGAESGPGLASPGTPGSPDGPEATSGTPAEPCAPRPVPLQQAPLARLVTN